MRLLCLLLLLLPACTAPRDQVVLLAVTEPGGTLTVTTPRQTRTLDAAYQTATARPSGRLDAGITTAEIVQARWGDVLRATPAESRRYTLYFASGGTALASESQTVRDTLLADIAACAACEVLLEGYTDTVGDARANEALSLARAEAVHALLVAAGMQATFVRVVGRGERDLARPTPDETPEARNRRVEVLVR